MPETPKYTRSETVNRLIDAIKTHEISVRTLPNSDVLDVYALREVELRIGAERFRCLGDNECGDMDADNLPLLLSMILMELEAYDEVEDYLEWCREQAMPPGDAITRVLWDRLAENRAAIPKHLPEGLRSIGPFDWHLGAGATRILRNLPKELARPDLY